MSWYNGSMTIMKQTPPKSLVMAMKQASPRTYTIQYGMWYCMIWQQSWTIMGIHSHNLLGENNPEVVQKNPIMIIYK
jgi:hypothetical protein